MRDTSLVLYDHDTVHQMMIHDLRYHRCPICFGYAVRDAGSLSRRSNEGAPTMITTISVCPEHSLIITENDDWGGRTIERVSDDVKWA